MQESFPKIDLRGKDDAAYYFDQIRRHALKLVQRELEKDKLGKDKEAFSICNKAIDEVCISQREMIERGREGLFWLVFTTVDFIVTEEDGA